MLEKPFVSEKDFLIFLDSKGLMDEYLQKSISLAKHVHGNVTRDDGVEYLYQHVYPIAVDAYDRLGTKRAVILALLHDVLEDSEEKEVHDEVKKLDDGIYEDLLLLVKPKQFIEGQPRTIEMKHKEHKMFVEQLSNARFDVKMIKGIDRLNNILCTEAVNSPQKYIRF